MKRLLIGFLTLSSFLFLFIPAGAQWGQKWSSTETSMLGTYDFVGISNVDGDPQLEIVWFKWISSDIDHLVITDAATGLKEWESGNLGNASSTYAHIADVDGDGVNEVIFWSAGGDDLIYCYDSNTLGVNDNSSGSQLMQPKLEQNYPNPFNPTTTIEYSVQNPAKVTITVYNVLGQKVKTLVDEQKPRGDYSVQWDGKNDVGAQVASGVYFYKLSVGDYVSSKKMVTLK